MMGNNFAYLFGYLAEFRVMIYMMLRGYIPIAHRLRTKCGEIDIIMQSRREIVFIEVKARSKVIHGIDVADVISARQITRIKMASNMYCDIRKIEDREIRNILAVVGPLCISVRLFNLDI